MNYDGFRGAGLHRIRFGPLVSPKGNLYKSFAGLCRNASKRQAWFENPHPQVGQPQVYANDPSTSNCQILFVPNLAATGNLLVISGTDPEGTETGAGFLTRDAGLASLQKSLHSDRLPYFEVVLKSVRVGGATSGSEIVFSRRIPVSP